jgi:hypothetical protein
MTAVSRNRATGQGRTAASAPRRSIIWPLTWQAGDSLLLLPGSSRTAAAALRTSPDDLAAELNPHKTELNPHKTVEAASRARTDQTGLPSSGQSRRHGSWQRQGCHAARDPLCP